MLIAYFLIKGKLTELYLFIFNSSIVKEKLKFCLLIAYYLIKGKLTELNLLSSIVV